MKNKYYKQQQCINQTVIYNHPFLSVEHWKGSSDYKSDVTTNDSNKIWIECDHWTNQTNIIHYDIFQGFSLTIKSPS